MELKGIGGIGVSAAFPLEKSATTTSLADGAGKFFQELVGKVNDLSQQSDQAIQKLATGENRNLHETMIAVEKASVSFLFMSQVRNKALEAYQEVMRMPV
jgi:flagellar hook-basal body complex protein FliE